MFYSSQSPTETTDDRELKVLSVVHSAQNGDSHHDARSTTDSGEVGTTPKPPHVSQRSIAHALGMSVGLTNAILKRLTEKGFVMMRRINHNNVHYLVTPEGIDQLSRRSYLYLRRTIGNVVRYKERIRAFCREQKERGVREIVLVGESDLTFILEWCTDKEGLQFRHVGSIEEMGADVGAAHVDNRSGILFVLSEYILETGLSDVALLHRVVLGLP
jgi:DNA-binding MarR family transcriptional regulator